LLPCYAKLMLIKILRKGGREPLVIDDATLMIVEDAKGNPVSLACEYGLPGRLGTFEVSHCKDPEFNTLLHRLGINKTVIVENLADSLKDPRTLPVAGSMFGGV